MRFITSENLEKLLFELSKNYDVFVPVNKNDQRYYKKYSEDIENMTIGEVRAFDPLKAFFFQAREKVAEGYSPELLHTYDKPRCLVGVKACDLKGFLVQDHVFNDEDYQDYTYLRAREKNLIISSDCTCTIETCFCMAMDVKPFPVSDYDLNLSEIEGGFLVSIGSEKGKLTLKKHLELFDKATESMTKARDRIRARVVDEVESNVEKNNVPHQDKLKNVISEKYESDIWANEAEKCVECGACNTICPTCHCFLLYDQKNEESIARFRIWDSCLIKDFARVGGGENPREKLWMRLRNRFEKKFDFFPKVAGIYACTGCGRCISACPGKIDIRTVLNRLVSDD